MKTLIVTLSLAFAFTSFANEEQHGGHKMDPAKKELMKADAEAINSACATEAATAGCKDAKVGTGLLKCIHHYRKENKDKFKVSDACHAAMKKMKGDRHSN